MESKSKLVSILITNSKTHKSLHENFYHRLTILSHWKKKRNNDI